MDRGAWRAAVRGTAESGVSERLRLLLSGTGSGVQTSVAEPQGLCRCGSGSLEPKLNSCGLWASLLRGMWALPGPGVALESLVLAGRFFTTESPGKPWISSF